MNAGGALAAAGAAGLAASALGLAVGTAWLKPFFFLPAWWSLLALLVGLNRRGPRAPGSARDAAVFARRAAVSVPFWLAYEALNLRLRDWEYIGLPEPRGPRWAGYALAFATVLPAILETAAFLRARWPAGETGARRPWLLGPGAAAAQSGLGALCLALPLWEPALFFPLVWASAFLLFEPAVAAKRPAASWLAALAEGSSRDLRVLLTSGLLCGLAWEGLNFWAGGKWRYTFPWPRGPKLFEMPWLGFVGFLPFALGAASAWHAFDIWWEEAELGARVATVLLGAAAVLLGFQAIDAGTVRSFVPL